METIGHCSSSPDMDGHIEPTSSSVALSDDGYGPTDSNKSPTGGDTVGDAIGSPSLSSVASTLFPSSPPRSPPRRKASSSPSSSSPTTAADRSSTSNKRPAALHNTPQMFVLGKDGSDYRDLLNNSISRRTPAERQQDLLDEQEQHQNDNFVNEQSQNAPLQQQQQGNSTTSNAKWWNRLWHGMSTSTSAGASYNSDDYSNMEQVEGAVERRSTRRKIRVHHDYEHNNNATSNNGNDDVEAPVYYHDIEDSRTTLDPLQSPPLPRQKSSSIGIMHQSILRSLPLPSTKEDQIQMDCSFLYRPVDENTPSRSGNRRSLRAIIDPPPRGVSTLYRDAQDVLSPPAMAQYRAKYQQLNQEYAPRDDYDRFADYNDYAVTPTHELTLEEQQQQQQPSRHQRHSSFVTDVASQSSLFFQHEANGRVVLRLPRDHVRLLVADSTVMEPGILSVIQCRNRDDPPTQRLEYCLTVPPNLYQQVVSEMTRYSGHWAIRGGGLDSSFYASDHADIRVAIGIMTVIMLVLGINTIVFGLN